MATLHDVLGALAQLGVSYRDEAAWSTVVHFCRSRWEIPLALSVTYLAMVYVTRPVIRQHNYGGLVDGAFAVWNLSLSLFSGWGVYNMGRSFVLGLQKETFYFTVCADTKSLMRYSGDTPTSLALALFCLSKVPELGDTVFLILKRKPVRLLQWYHHVSVMLFCWLALATEYTPGCWFAVTNYFVHSVMYMYFFLMAFKSTARFVKPLGPIVTIIQITQMVWGLIVNGIAVTSYFLAGDCQIQAVTVYCAVAMYASYFWLFSKLFLDSRRKGKGQTTWRSTSRKSSKVLLQESSTSEEELSERSKKVN